MPTGVYPRTQAIRDRMREIALARPRSPRLGHHHSAETKRAMSENRKGRTPWNKGITGAVHSDETRLKMSRSRKGNRRPARSEEWCLRISRAKLGKKQQPDVIARRAAKLKGKKHTLETRKRLSAIKRGANNPQWKGGTTKANLAIRATLEYKLWREAVFKRDKWTCVHCGTRRVPLNADHIKPFCKFPDLRFEIDNGRTLCVPCHKKTDTYGVNAGKAA